MQFLDSHCHLGSLEGDIELILKRAKDAGIATIINIATTPEELDFGVNLAKKSAIPIFHAAATTPHDVEAQGDLHFDAFCARLSFLTAIGETGLDYFHSHSPRELQQHFLRKYIGLATENNLPMLFHCREAFADLFRIVDEENYQSPALLHCFTGTLDEAKELVSRGWYLSISGIATFKKSEALREVIKETPLSHLMIETDAPYLAPGIHRGKQNEPAYVIETAKCVAEVKGVSLEEVAEVTGYNVRQFFRLN